MRIDGQLQALGLSLPGSLQMQPGISPPAGTSVAA